MPDIFANVAVGIIKGLVYAYDFVTWPIYFLVFSPVYKLSKSNRIKARPENDDPGKPWRSVDSDHLVTTLIPGCDTVDELFKRAVDNYGPNRCLGKRELLSEEDEKQPSGKVFKKAIFGKYSWWNYEEVYEKVTNFGAGLLLLGLKPGEKIVIFAETSPEWIIAAQACLKYNFPIVTLYATLGEEAVQYGVNETEVSIVITSYAQVHKFKDTLPNMPTVQHIIYIEHPDHSKTPDTKDFPTNVRVHSMLDVEQEGANNKIEEGTCPKTKSSDLAVIMYTSGSTGPPKGVLLSHGNLMSAIAGQCNRVGHLGLGDVYIAYLPLAHVLELTAELACLAHGVALGYSSPQTITDQSTRIKRGSKGDATVLKPTLLAAVPLIADRLYKNVWEKVNEGSLFSRKLFHFAYNYKLAKYESGNSTPIIDRLVFKRVRAILGGRLRLMLCGGAPLSADSQRFMNILFCCPVGQGYGLTETAGAGTVHEATDRSTGRVGAPVICCQVLLRDWEEGGYTPYDEPNPRGEILIGGGNVAMGYYKNEEKTTEDFLTIDGIRYFCTGDIGEFKEDGCLQIIDRKKDLVKLQAGEYVSLSKVETALKMHPLIDNVCLYGDSGQNYTVALICPNMKNLKQLASGLGLDTGDMDSVCHSKIVEKEMMKAVNEEGKKAKLNRSEIPQKVTVVSDQWTPDEGLVTDAFKLKRKPIFNKYEGLIKAMYNSK
ncbi:long-chain-fatty-acid--CoA ligase 4 [Lingula anatina]|uniref:long-chain-fatty-acid--CoA ligase n=1 Tax=Lingula anatina TaxID=7574 RepID=A0A1S3HDG1_LINAN|nr:long-chain-fatty-acid--CoA ligase 4 [Lingula anatina]|eukprot:XP_013383556.1 long-chain-fatty-acid--CoA ligase 4 [Lingula anatina]